MKQNPGHKYRNVQIVGKMPGGSVIWCGRCGHIPLKNDASRKITDKGCWSWDNQYKTERDEDEE